jgi:GrpB-like predicted nucleotidyltransferase (UPF0157 family)
MATRQCVVGKYLYSSARLLPHDPRTEEAARTVTGAITEIEPRFRVEHVGSTAVPGLAGKGIVDLMLVYPEGMLPRARAVLDDLGFQRQNFGDPFPEDRPMRIGTVEIDGAEIKLHVHVIAESSPEVGEFLRFRDRLRTDRRLRGAYEDRKRRLIEAGITESPEYARRKGSFIRACLDRAARRAG